MTGSAQGTDVTICSVPWPSAEPWGHILDSPNGHLEMGRHTLWQLHTGVRIFSNYPYHVKRHTWGEKVGFSPAGLQMRTPWYQDWLLNAPVPPERWERPYTSFTGRGLSWNAKVQDQREQVGCDEAMDLGMPVYGQSLTCWVPGHGFASSCLFIPGWEA